MILMILICCCQACEANKTVGAKEMKEVLIANDNEQVTKGRPGLAVQQQLCYTHYLTAWAG